MVNYVEVRVKKHRKIAEFRSRKRGTHFTLG